MHSIVFLFNKNSFKTLSDITRHWMYLLFRIFDERFKLRTLLYTLYYTHLHINMMLMQCFSKRLYSVTPRVLQIYPLKQNLDPRFHVPSVGKEIGIHFNASNYLSDQKQDGVILQYIALLLPRGFILWVVLPLHLVELHHIVPCHSFLFIQDFDRVLNISQIRLEWKSFNFYSFIRDPQTFLQLWDVKHIVYHR